MVSYIFYPRIMDAYLFLLILSLKLKFAHCILASVLYFTITIPSTYKDEIYGRGIACHFFFFKDFNNSKLNEKNVNIIYMYITNNNFVDAITIDNLFIASLLFAIMQSVKDVLVSNLLLYCCPFPWNWLWCCYEFKNGAAFIYSESENI